MRVGFVGLGKLGLPVALAIESKGHEICGYDLNPEVRSYIAERRYPYQEEGVGDLLGVSNLKVMATIADVVAASDIVFCPVQTPHHPRFEGSTRLPDERADFDYSFLRGAVHEVAREAETLAKRTTLAVISTCLPGTFEREIEPLLNGYVDYVYTPQFIAMGTVIRDYLEPEFALIGVRSAAAAARLGAFYRTLFDRPHVVTDILTAEGIKVSYNTWITAKTVIANTWGEIAERTGMDFGAIHAAWQHATDRLVSTKYMDAGMGDGGGCHPRDNIAMSYLADLVGLSHNLFEDLIRAREDYEEWHAQVARACALERELSLVLLGRAFKPGTRIETGSPALLMAEFLPPGSFTHVEDIEEPLPAVYFVATKHDRYRDIMFPPGSVVIDPFGFIEDQPDVEVRRLGRR